MSTGLHCDLCDLPRAQCQHGLARRERRAANKAKKKASAKRATKAASSKTAAFPARPEKCSRCGQKAPQGRYWMCTACLLKTGATKCTQCKKAFKPEEGYTSRKPKCRSCRTKGKGSVWTVASAGAPSLGKRR